MQLGGPVLISIAFALVWCGIALLWIQMSGVRKAPLIGAVFFLAFVLGVQMRFEPRPEVFSYMFLALMIHLIGGLDLSRKISWRALAALFALESLWAGFHGYFALGPMVALALMASVVWEGQWRLNTRAAAIFAAVGLGSLASPFGWKVWEGVFRYAELGRALSEINHELMPTPMLTLYWPLTIFWIYWLFAFGMAVMLLYRRRNCFAAFLALGGIVLSIQATRNVPLFFIMVAPLTSVALDSLVRFEPRRKMWAYIPSFLSVALAGFVVHGDYHKWQSSLGTFGFGLEKSAYPVEATKFLQQLGFHGRIFADSYDGGYLEYQMPDVKIAGDSYFSDGDETLKFFSAIRSPLEFESMNERYQFDALVISVENQDVLAALWNNSAWKMVYADSHRTVFLRPEIPSPDFDLLKAKFYGGEDLSHWTYAFGVTTWAQMAGKMRNVPLMKKILSDLSASSVVPYGVLEAAAYLSLHADDPELVKMTQNLKAKMN